MVRTTKSAALLSNLGLNSKATLAFDQCHDRLLMSRANDGIALAVARLLAHLKVAWSLSDRAFSLMVCLAFKRR